MYVHAQRNTSGATTMYITMNICCAMYIYNLYVCRGKAAAENYRTAAENYRTVVQEKQAESKAKAAVEARLKAVTTKLKRFEKKNDNVVELQRRVNNLAGIEEERDRAEAKWVLLGLGLVIACCLLSTICIIVINLFTVACLYAGEKQRQKITTQLCWKNKLRAKPRRQWRPG